MQTLLDAGSDPNASDRWGNTPLHDAIAYERATGASDAVRILRAAGARDADTKVDSEVPPSLPQAEIAEKPKGQPAITTPHASQTRCSIALSVAIHEDDEETVAQLLRTGIDVNVGDYDGRTPLTVRIAPSQPWGSARSPALHCRGRHVEGRCAFCLQSVVLVV